MGDAYDTAQDESRDQVADEIAGDWLDVIEDEELVDTASEDPDADPCRGIDCSGHGTCEVRDGGPECVCEEGFHPVPGPDCEEDNIPPCDGPTVNAMIRGDGSILPVYKVDDAMSFVSSVGFVFDGETVTALDLDENILWTSETGAGALFGGFDFDEDGWPDLGLVRSEPTGEICGSTPTVNTWILFLRGISGDQIDAVAPMPDICWDFSGTIYPTSQWTTADVLFGKDMPVLALSPYYATTSWFYLWADGFTSESFYYPSSSLYDGTYTADRPNAWGTGTSHLPNSHVANGLLVDVDGDSRLVFFTSGRVVQYDAGPLGPDQLIADTPFLSGGRTDMAGRNYGLVGRDPQDPDKIVLISGTTAYSLYADLTSASMTFDTWGQIERHVTIYSLAARTVDDRFYSYAHDAGDGHKYENRVTYPDTPFVETGVERPSRLAYTVYTGGHWYIHVSQPGSTADALTLRGQFLWDIRDLDGDGIEEWIISPVEYPDDPDVPGYYYPKWHTTLHHWNETDMALEAIGSFVGYVPALVSTFRRPERTTSMSFLYPVLTTVTSPECTLKLVLRSQEGEIELADVPGG